MPADCLAIRLGGLSKSAGLPQVKLAWMAISGPDAIVTRAMEEIKLIADTYLSVSTPVQVAAILIASGAHVRSQILERVRRNYDALRVGAASHPAIEVLRADAGWSAVIRVPSTKSEGESRDRPSRGRRVLVIRASFDFPRECYLVLSLLAEPETFDEGARRSSIAPMDDPLGSRFAKGRHAGLIAPLFSIPSRSSWGIGEIADLPLFARWLAAAGLDSYSCCQSTRCQMARARRIRR